MFTLEELKKYKTPRLPRPSAGRIDRQRNKLELIASENFTSPAVRFAAMAVS